MLDFRENFSGFETICVLIIERYFRVQNGSNGLWSLGLLAPINRNQAGVLLPATATATAVFSVSFANGYRYANQELDSFGEVEWGIAGQTNGWWLEHSKVPYNHEIITSGFSLYGISPTFTVPEVVPEPTSFACFVVLGVCVRKLMHRGTQT